MELSDLSLSEPSSCATTTTTRSSPLPAEEENSIVLSEEDRAVARAALAERMKRKHPTRSAPRWFDVGDLAMVTACSSAIDGGGDTKLQAHREAIVGAFLVSKDGPPTVRFIWGKLDHFLGVCRAKARPTPSCRFSLEGSGAAALEHPIGGVHPWLRRGGALVSMDGHRERAT